MPLGRWPDVTIADARRRKAEAVAAVATGDDPWYKRQEARRRRDGITLDQVFDEWVAEVGCNKRSIDQDILRYRMNLKGGYRFTRGRLNGRTHKSGIGHLPIADIKRLDISNCLSEVRRRSASQAHMSVILLNTVLGWARQMGYIEVNPAEDQPFRLKKKVRDRYLSEDEIRVFWHALETDPHIMPTTRICLRLLLLTGSRREDWAEAPKSELRDGCLVVAAERFKSYSPHSPVSDGTRPSRCRIAARSKVALDLSESRRLWSTISHRAHERALTHRSHGQVSTPAQARTRNAPQFAPILMTWEEELRRIFKASS